MQLASALADQTQHQRIRVAVLRQHGQESGLADAGAREDAEALAALAGREQVERAHAEIQTFAQALTEMGGDGARLHGVVDWPVHKGRALI